MAIEHFLQTSMDLYEALDSNLPEDKVVLVGNPGVGKSTIFQRFKTGKFVREEELTHHDKDGQECYKAWTVGEQQVSVSCSYSCLSVVSKSGMLACMPAHPLRTLHLSIVSVLGIGEAFNNLMSNPHCWMHAT